MDARTVGFGERHFGAAKFGDRRLTSAWIRIGDRMAEHPGGTLPEQMESPAELEGCTALPTTPK